MWGYETSTTLAQEHLIEIGSSALVRQAPHYPAVLVAQFRTRRSPISVVIPTAFKTRIGGDMYLNDLLRSLRPFLNESIGDEIILIHGSGEKPSQKFPIYKTTTISAIEDSESFNFSRRSNIGFLSSKNEHILLINDDVKFGSDNPLDQLFGILELPQVGLVGALLVYPDYSIQHAGHTFENAGPHHAHYKSRNLGENSSDLIVDRECVGVTGALMFQLKSTWRSVGGFSNLFPNNFNDVDYCLKIRSLGLSIIQANSVQGIHLESVSRTTHVRKFELDVLNNRWTDALRN
jgi:hypothetical protein